MYFTVFTRTCITFLIIFQSYVYSDSKISYDYVSWPSWPRHPVPMEDRHVFHYIEVRVNNLQCKLVDEEKELENREALELELQQLSQMQVEMGEKWRKIDDRFLLLNGGLSHLEATRQTRVIPFEEFETIMLEFIVPAAHEYVDAFYNVMQLRRNACHGILNGKRKSLMNDNDFAKLVMHRNNFVTEFPLDRTERHRNHFLRWSLLEFNDNVKFLVKMDNRANDTA